LSRFEKEDHFVSHLRLSPHKPTSGGKPLKKKRRNTATTRVAAALRMAALSLRYSQTALGAYYRHISRRIGADVAVFATARKSDTPREAGGLMSDRRPRAGTSLAAETGAT
jgi:hypothetical protein